MLILSNNQNSNIFWISLWIGIFIFALIIELCTEQIVSIWFSGAALICFILALCKIYWWIQIIVFVVCSIALLLCSRPFIRKVLQKDIPTNIDSLIGTSIQVISKVTPTTTGEGKIRDITWSLITNDVVINEGEFATIIAIEGNKLRVKRKEL